MEKRRQLGSDSESIARQYLEQRGYTLVQSNFRCRTGEIDLIMEKQIQKGRVLVFVEVRSRTSHIYGTPMETVNKSKQDKIRKVAAYYLYRNPQFQDHYCRFDVVSILWQSGQSKITWIEDAFQ